jgi:quinol monooxygenase YgiN
LTNILCTSKLPPPNISTLETMEGCVRAKLIQTIANPNKIIVLDYWHSILYLEFHQGDYYFGKKFIIL